MNRLYKIILGALLVAGCSANDTEKATALLEEARQATAANSFDEARALIDSLRNTYPKEFDVRREALQFVDSLELASAKQEFAVADSINTFVSFELEDMKKQFVFEKQEKYQQTGYYVTPEYAGNKEAFSFFPEVEETGKMLLVSIDAKRRYEFTEVPLEETADVQSLYNKYDLTDKQRKAVKACEALARLMAKQKAISEQKEKMDLKVRFFQKKITEGVE